MDIPSKWKDVTHVPTLKILMIDPHNINVSRGVLSGVVKVTLTDGYYSDTKISGTLETIADNYISGSWIRILVDDEPVATLGISKVSVKQAPEQAESKSYELQSVLWMLDEDMTGNQYTIGANTKYSTVFTNLVQKVCGKSLELEAGYHDGMYNSAVTYEATDSFRSILSDVCATSDNQLSVNGLGCVKVSAYISPESKAISWTIDADDPMGIVLDPGYEDTDETGTAYNRSIVIATGNDNQTITVSSDAPASNPISSSVRGWTRAQIHQVSDMNPFTYARAYQLLNQYATSDRSQGIQRDATCMYFPVNGGEVIEWVQNNTKTKYLVQTVEHDLDAWTSKLTLKKV